MATCEICGEYLKQKIVPNSESDNIWVITHFPGDEDGSDPQRSAPRNYFCSRECAIEGLEDGTVKKSTEEKIRRSAELRRSLGKENPRCNPVEKVD